eukprot:6743356-Prymnesium_polylepis.1
MALTCASSRSRALVCTLGSGSRSSKTGCGEPVGGQTCAMAPLLSRCIWHASRDKAMPPSGDGDRISRPAGARQSVSRRRLRQSVTCSAGRCEAAQSGVNAATVRRC